MKIAAEQANKQLQNGEITQQQYDALQREIIATEAELRRLENQASKTNKMFSSIGNVGANIEKAGDSVTNVGKKVSVVSAAGNIDLASDMVTDAMSALGMKTSDASKMVNQMAKTSSTTNTSVAQLGEGILTIGATAKSVKGGTAELNTALGILANNGIKGAEGEHI